MFRITKYLLWRACRIISGLVLLIVGLFLSFPGIPGPGIVLVVLGLGVLSHEFYWAEKLYARIKQMGHNILQRRKQTAVKEDQHG
jgi:hypothetical protein